MRTFCLSLALIAISLATEIRLSAETQTIMVPMRDGIELATDVHLPAGEGPWPCVLTRTPYSKFVARGAAKQFTDAGFVYVAQDCRGRFSSQGEYEPFRQDHHDGYDMVEWIAEQAWSNKKVGMVGRSAMGITTNLAATQIPPHLVCGYVEVAPATARRNTVYMGGVYRKEMNDGWLLGMNATYAIDQTMENPPASEFWNWREIPDFHHRIKIPICNVGGWFDIFAQGTLDNFVGLQCNGAGLAAGNQKLVMAPVGHGALGGRLRFPEGQLTAYGTQHQLRWFDRWLKGIDNGIDRELPVNFYLMGDTEDPDAPGNRWCQAVSWPPPSRPVSFLLQPELGLETQRADSTDSITYEYDPTNPVQTVGGSNLISGGRGPMDQRAIKDRQDYLRFQSEPLQEPTTVAGRISVDLFVSTDAPDTDFSAKLVDVYPDGYEALLTDGIIRTRYRDGIDQEKPMSPGEIVRVRIDLLSTAIVFNRGHRIALHISSSNDPRFDPNPNTGHPQRADDETRVARNTVHFGGPYQSRLLLPVVVDEL